MKNNGGRAREDKRVGRIRGRFIPLSTLGQMMLKDHTWRFKPASLHQAKENDHETRTR